MNNIETIKNEKKNKYSHFDKPISTLDSWDYISNPEKVKTHSFFPFIRFSSYKTVCKKGKKEEVADLKEFKKSKNFEYTKNGEDMIKFFYKKERIISYASHLDSCIHKYYAFSINEAYNNYIKQNKFDQSIIGYRTDLDGKNNIDHALEVFKCIKSKDSCKILVGDFKNFFDTLDHKVLKSNLKKVLNLKDLPDDYYVVYKHITKFKICKYEEIKILAKNYNYNKHHPILPQNAFIKDMVPKLKGQKAEIVGIPQGSSLSAVFSNIYMIDFDKYIYEAVNNLGGIYRRYSDDFICVIPDNCSISIEKLHNDILYECKKIKLELSPNKTHMYKVENSTISDASNNQCRIDYLGFMFDGRKVSIRDKSISKYYRRMYKKAKGIVKSNYKTKKGNKINNVVLYGNYSSRWHDIISKKIFIEKKSGKKTNDRISESGNFITYIERAYEKVKINNNLGSILKKHKSKIRKALSKKRLLNIQKNHNHNYQARQNYKNFIYKIKQKTKKIF